MLPKNLVKRSSEIAPSQNLVDRVCGELLSDIQIMRLSGCCSEVCILRRYEMPRLISLFILPSPSGVRFSRQYPDVY